jgi:hypothetical protein
VSLDNASQAFSRRRLNVCRSGQRISRPNREISSIKQSSEMLECGVELDSHADTCGVNHVAKVLEIYGQVAQVPGFAESMTPLQDIPIVKAALAYDMPETGEVIVLIINQALYFGDALSNVLLNPNQLWLNNITVDDVPKHLSTKSTHSIIINEENLTIPLKLNGIISYFNARTPTNDKINNCSHIILASPNEWNPYSTEFADNEKKWLKIFKLQPLHVNTWNVQTGGSRKWQQSN